jgi:hypothetical protein
MAEHEQVVREVAERYASALQDLLGDALVAVVLFGSAARGEAKAISDIDLLVVADDLPARRLARHERVRPADEAVQADLAGLRKTGIFVDLHVLLKTPGEAAGLRPLYLDLVEDAVILYDRGGFFAGVLARLRASLDRLGARRLSRGHLRYWDLKPDYKPGEVFTI